MIAAGLTPGDARMAGKTGSNGRARKATTPSTFAGRLTALRRRMKARKVAAYLVSRRRDAFYLTGFTGEDSAMIVTPKQVHLLSDGRFDEVINQECPWVIKRLRKGSLTDEIAHACRDLKIRSLGVQADGLSVADYQAIDKAAKGTKLVAAPAMPAEMRRHKDAVELKAMRKAIRVAEEAFAATCESIRLGQTELDIAARLEFEMKQRGASEPAFATIVAEGPNAALPHAHPGRRKVRSGSAILIDWGARVGTYCSDLTRVIFIGSIPPKFAAMYRVCLDAQLKAIAAIRPGVRMCDVDKVARDIIDASEFKGAFTHGLGHGLGLDVHEPPSLSWRSDEKLAVGMIVTVEPGIYLPGVGGVRIEDDVLVTKGGRRVLTSVEKRLEQMVLPAR
jgi:Xaa-Pro aminopeptidase